MTVIENKCLELGGNYHQELKIENNKVKSIYVCEFNNRKLPDAYQRFLEYSKFLFSIQDQLDDNKAISQLIETNDETVKDIALIVSKDKATLDLIAKKKMIIERVITPEYGMAMYNIRKQELEFHVIEDVNQSNFESVLDKLQRESEKYFSLYKKEKEEEVKVRSV